MEKAELELKVADLELTNLRLQIELNEANLAGFQQSVAFAMDKIPQLQQRVVALQAELNRRTEPPKEPS